MTLRNDRRALLVDLDGTLADSLSVMRVVYGRFLDGFSAVATDCEFALLNGPPLTAVVHLLKEAHNLPDPEDELFSRYCHLVDEAYLETAPMAGAHALLARARVLGYTVGLVTSNSARRTQDWLDRVGLKKAVDVMVAGEDVLCGKPAPEPYLLAIARTGCSVAASIAVEDSPQGARSAVDAGLRTFVLDPDPAIDWPPDVERIPSLSHLAEHLLP